MPDEVGGAGVGLEYPEQRWIEKQHERRRRPDRQQHDLASQIVADLYFFLEFVGRLVDLVIALGLEEEMTGLPGRHRNQPADQRRQRRVREHQRIGDEEADRADQVQGLVDPAVVIITMIVPSLQFEGLEEAFHQSPPFFGSGGRSSTILHPSAVAAAMRTRPAS